MLIVFEGIDGAGKSTQARLALETLERRGVPAVLLREPTDGQYGARLRGLAGQGRDSVSPQEECELFRLDRMEDVTRNIAPAFASGKVVLLDRYYFSTMAYQGALGLDPERIRQDNEAFAPVPNLALYYDMAPERAAERIRNGRGEALNLFERVDYLRRVRAIYRSFVFPYWRTIDASRPVEAIRLETQAAINAAMSGGRSGHDTNH